MMNVDSLVGGSFSFLKYDIGEYGVGVVFFFNKKLVTMILKPHLHN
jgi:hypothetical protein